MKFSTIVHCLTLEKYCLEVNFIPAECTLWEDSLYFALAECTLKRVWPIKGHFSDSLCGREVPYFTIIATVELVGSVLVYLHPPLQILICVRLNWFLFLNFIFHLGSPECCNLQCHVRALHTLGHLPRLADP